MSVPKLLTKFLVISVLVFAMVNTVSFTTVEAKSRNRKPKNTIVSSEPIFQENFTITNHNTKVDIGFVTVHFKKHFIAADMYPLTLEIKLYQEDGKIWIEFSPDVEYFLKDVTIHVHAYEGFILDIDQGDFVYVDVPHFVFKVSHFSRWCFIW